MHKTGVPDRLDEHVGPPGGGDRGGDPLPLDPGNGGMIRVEHAQSDIEILELGQGVGDQPERDIVPRLMGLVVTGRAVATVGRGRLETVQSGLCGRSPGSQCSP